MMAPSYGFVWKLVAAAIPVELGAQSAGHLHQVIVQAAGRLEKAFDALPDSDQRDLVLELSELTRGFIESSRFTAAAAASVLRDEREEPTIMETSSTSAPISKVEAVRAATHLVIGSIVLRRALTITNDPSTADAIGSAIRLQGVDERIATRFYDFAAARRLVPLE